MFDIYTLENESLKIKVSSLGGTILSFIDKKDNIDIVLGFKDISEYPNTGEYFGAMVGRNANRIAKAKFSLNDVTYNLDINNGPNNLHGGLDTFAFKEFECDYYENNRLALRYNSKDKESGFPGNLTFVVIYSLKGNVLKIEYSGTSDQDTLFNITNHSYFNLGEEIILNHEMYIPTDKVCLIDEDGMATEQVIDVKNTSFDFTNYKKIGDNLALKHDNLSNGGIDHNYLFEDLNNKLLVKLRNNKYELSVSSNSPNVQIYTANYIFDLEGKKHYKQYAGVAIEPQYVPNAINYDKFLKPILKKNETKAYSIEYKLDRR